MSPRHRAAQAAGRAEDDEATGRPVGPAAPARGSRQRLRLVPWLPGNAGAAVMQLGPAGLLAPWAGIAVFAGYAVLLLAVAALVLRRRDA